MRIESLVAENYRQYQHIEFSFPRNGKHSLYTLIARNGIGKSNFLNAITWCLYDEEPYLTGKAKALPQLNLNIYEAMSVNDNATIKITITLKSIDDTIFITRTKRARRVTDDSEPLFYLDNILEVNVIGDRPKSYNGDDAKRYIDRILPQDIRAYFFFDNEQMDQYFIEQGAVSIKKSVFLISQVKLLEDVSEQLNKVIEEYIKKMGRKAPDVEALRVQYENIKDLNEERVGDIEKIKKSIATSRTVIADCDKYLSNIGDMRELQEKEANIKTLLNEAEDNKRSKMQEIKRFINEYTICLSFYSEMVKLKKTIESMENNGKLPPQVNIDFLRKMIKENTCLICGNTLEDGEIDQINKMIEDIEVPNKLSHLLNNISTPLAINIEKAEKYNEIKKAILQELKSIKDRIIIINEQHEDVSKEIDKCADKNKALEYSDKKRDHEKLIQTNTEKMAVAKRNLDIYQQKEVDAFDELNKAISKMNSNKELIQYKEYAEKLKRITDDVHDEVIQDMKKTICEKTYELFTTLLWKENTYKAVEIDDNYNVDLIHNSGLSALGSCSAAERSLLALSFTLALHQVSGFDAPLVIDSPVGRVSDTNRENFARVLVNVSEKKQVTLLFTPSEYSEEIVPLFNKNSAKIYSICTDDERTSYLKEGYDGI